LPTLSGKLVTLLALATLLRVSEIASIAFASVELAGNTVRFLLSKPRKSQRSGPLQSFTLSACPDLNTCLVEASRAYVNVLVSIDHRFKMACCSSLLSPLSEP
jgi:hypothetical protein